MDIGHLIKDGLARKKMRQIDLARKIGKSPQQISDWIKGRKTPQVADFVKLIVELDIVTDLFPGYAKGTENSEADELMTVKNRLVNLEETLRDVVGALNSQGKTITFHGPVNHNGKGNVVN